MDDAAVGGDGDVPKHRGGFGSKSAIWESGKFPTKAAFPEKLDFASKNCTYRKCLV